MSNRQLGRGFLIPVFILAAACGRNISPNPPPNGQPGQEDFTSQAPTQGGGDRQSPGAAGGATNAGAPSPGTASGSASGTRTIQEADIYKVVGNTLFVLNTYRGLQIIDVTDLTQPKLLARVPVVGRPVDLYVENGTAYVAVSDYFMYWWGADAVGAGDLAAPSITSQVWAIDVTKPASPVVLGTLPIDGDLDQTRIVGNVLYVQSRQWSWWYPGVNGSGQNQNLTYVASFDISNPSAMKQADRVDFPTQGWDTHANITVNRITISQTGWDSTSNQQITDFQVIDISDPSGKLALGTTFSIPGAVTERWAMDFDDTSGLFRVISQTGWNAGAAVDTWWIPSPTTASKLGHVDLNVPESVTAASFDTGRAYVVTANCVDPLWIVDTSNPSAPTVKGSVSMSGALDFIEPRGNQLIAFGHNSDSCHSMSGQGLNVSLFDVSNPSAPSMLSRVDFGGTYTYIDAQADDYKKVFQVLDSLGLILVPYSSWDATNWTYTGGTQLVDFNSSGLTLRGFAGHAGTITRAFPVGNDVVALSDLSLQVLDISNRDNPVQVSAIDLARPVDRIALVNGYAVELSGDWYRGDTELTVTPTNDPESPTPITRLKVPAPYAQSFLDGNILWLMASNYDYTTGTSTAWLQAVDLTTPTNPVLRGKMALDPQDIAYWGWWGWGWGNQSALIGHSLVIHRAYWWYPCNGCGSQPQDEVKVLDLSNPDAPQLASTVALPNSSWSWGLTTAGNYAWITHYEWVPGSNYQSVKYYVDRIDLSNPYQPNLLPKINVPGVFFSASAAGDTIYTEDTAWSQNYSSATTYLYELQLKSNGKASLVAATSLNGYPGAQAVNGGYVYAQTWNWSNSQSSENLNTVDLNGMIVSDTQAITSQSGWMMEAAGGKLFVSAGWWDSGILIYDLAQASKPSYQGTVRTDGYIEDVVVANNTAYLPSGYYGVPMVDLTAGSPVIIP